MAPKRNPKWSAVPTTALLRLLAPFRRRQFERLKKLARSLRVGFDSTYPDKAKLPPSVLQVRVQEGWQGVGGGFSPQAEIKARGVSALKVGITVPGYPFWSLLSRFGPRRFGSLSFFNFLHTQVMEHDIINWINYSYI